MNQGAATNPSQTAVTNQPELNPWQDLFVGGDAQSGLMAIRFRTLRKRGVPFLFLPVDRARALHALDLYPAQRTQARLLKHCIRTLLRLDLPLPTGITEFEAARNSPFVECLKTAAGVTGRPEVAILAGNPMALGPRFIVLVFGPDAHPSCVVKAGTQPAAQSLIQREAQFLDSVKNRAIRTIPRLRGQWTTPTFSAFGMNFVSGKTPSAGQLPALAREVQNWIDREQLVRLPEIPAWQRLTSALRSSEPFGKLRNQIETLNLHPTIWHGDFAPWNIKQSTDGSWHVMDWERADTLGVPCWDLLHFKVQTLVLVRRLPASNIADELEEMLNENWFRSYAEAAQVAHVTRHLAVSSLLYQLTLNAATEGVDQCTRLLEVLGKRWNLE